MSATTPQKVPLTKICNVRSRSEVEVLHAAGVDIAGFRVLSDELEPEYVRRKAALMSYASELGMLTSLVCNSLDFERLAGYLDPTRPDYLQLHMSLAEGQRDAIGALFPDSKLVVLNTYEDVLLSGGVSEVADGDYRVLDWKRGGTGTFIGMGFYESLDPSDLKDRTFIAGGLNHQNVRSLLKAFTPHALDLDSSVRERSADGGKKEISQWKVQRFVDAVRQTAGPDPTTETQGHPTSSQIPFPKYDQAPWSSLGGNFVEDNQIVAKLNLLTLLDDQHAYQHSATPVQERIRGAVDMLFEHPAVSRQWAEAALAAFASTIYFPAGMLESSLQFLFLRLHRNMLELGRRDFKYHVFANDPGAINDDFFRVNAIQGRLDHEKNARVRGTEELARLMLSLDCNVPEVKDSSFKTVRGITAKDCWVLLVDQTLSGHSLEKDLDRLLKLQSRIHAVAGRSPIISVACQISTSTARKNLLARGPIRSAVNEGRLFIDEAIFLGEEFRLGSPFFSQVRSRKHTELLRELCEWFAHEYIAPEPDLERMRKRSGDDMRYGYRAAGLLIARQENCPTDSLPLLWHSGHGREGYNYVAPFPRNHSRIGPQSSEPSADNWGIIFGSDTIMAEFDRACHES